MRIHLGNLSWESHPKDLCLPTLSPWRTFVSLLCLPSSLCSHPFFFFFFCHMSRIIKHVISFMSHFLAQDMHSRWLAKTLQLTHTYTHTHTRTHACMLAHAHTHIFKMPPHKTLSLFAVEADLDWPFYNNEIEIHFIIMLSCPVYYEYDLRDKFMQIDVHHFLNCLCLLLKTPVSNSWLPAFLQNKYVI